MRLSRLFAGFFALAIFVAGVAVFSGLPQAPRPVQPDPGSSSELPAHPVEASFAPERTDVSYSKVDLRVSLDLGGMAVLEPKLSLRRARGGGEEIRLQVSSNGDYFLPEIGAGSYILRVTGDGWKESDFKLELSGNAPVVEKSIAPKSLSALSGYASQTLSGAAIEEFELELTFHFPGPRKTVYSQAFPTVSVQSPSGAFSLVGLPAEAVAVQVHASANTFASPRPLQRPLAGPTVWSDLRFDFLTEGQAFLPISGKVVSHETGQGVAGVTLRLAPPELTLQDIRIVDGKMLFPKGLGGEAFESFRAAKGRPRQTGPAGDFQWVIPAGQAVSVWAYAPGYEPAQSVLLHSYSADDLPPIEIALAPAPALEGTIHVGNAFAQAVRIGDVEVNGDGGTFVASVQDGVFRIEGIPAGDYEVALMSDRNGYPYAVSKDMVRVMPTGLTKADFHCGTGQEGSVFEGQVPHLDVPQPLNWSAILFTGALRGDFFRRVHADESGFFAWTELPDGEFSSLLMGRSKDSSRVAIALGTLRVPQDCQSAERQRLALSSSSVHGRVQLPVTEGPQKRVKLQFHTNSSDANWNSLVEHLEVKAAKDGTFVVHGLRPGSYSLETKNGAASTSFTITKGDVLDVTLQVN